MELIIKKLDAMFNMQNSLNIHTNGEFWATNHKNEKTGKIINWRRAIWLELAEFVDSFDWKHWKHGKNDTDNAKTELVDIWHFMLSASISENPTNSINIVKDAILASLEVKYHLSNDTLEMAEAMVQKVLDNKRPLHYKESIDDYSAYTIFFNLCSCVNLTYDELYQRYIVKNTLNEFRQNNGYNEGTYIKVWNGKEDNVVALELAEKLSEKLDRNTLLDRLTKQYKTLKQ